MFLSVEFLVFWVLECEGYVRLAATTVPSSEASVYSVCVGIFAGRLSHRMSENRPISFHISHSMLITFKTGRPIVSLVHKFVRTIWQTEHLKG